MRPRISWPFYCVFGELEPVSSHILFDNDFETLLLMTDRDVIFMI